MSDLDDRIRFREEQRALLEGDDVDSSRLMDEDLRRLGPSDFDMAQGANGLSGKLGEREQKWKGLVNRAPFTRGNPPSILQGSLGSTATVAVGGNPAQVALWSGDDAETTVVGVTLFPFDNLFMPNTSNPELRPYGIVKFGTHGCQATAYVDIGTGAQFSVNASEVSLQVGLDAVNGVGAANTAQISGMLSFGTPTRGAPIQRTVYLETVTVSSSKTVAIPAFAKNVTVQWNDPAATSNLEFFSTKTNIYTTGTLAGGANVPPIPIPGHAGFVQVTLVAALGSTANGVLVFELNL